jgi:MFS family permease
MVLNTTNGMRAFTYIWLGQLISSIGTGLTNFALGIWVYQTTGSVTKFTLIALFSGLPGALLLPLTGALIDRWDKRIVMISSISGAALVTLAAALLLSRGQLAVWHVYLGVTIRATFISLLNPAMLAATTVLVPKQHLGRSAGMFQTLQASTQVISPLLAAILMSRILLLGIFLVDFLSYLVALTILLIVRFGPQLAAVGSSKRDSLRSEIPRGWTYIRERPGLLALLIYFATVNLVLGCTTILFTPMILSFTTSQVLGTILSISGIGFLSGSLAMSLWGGPKNRVPGILNFGLAFGFCSVIVGLRPSPVLISLGAFGMYFFLPIVNGCSQAIWQSKIPVDLQGRVFAVRRMIGASTLPVAYLIAGPLADQVFEPLAMKQSFGGLIVRGPGRGIGLMFIVAGIFTMLAQLGGYLYVPLRRVERNLADAIPDPVISRMRC